MPSPIRSIARSGTRSSRSRDDDEAYLDTEAVTELLPEVCADDVARLLSYTEQQDIWYVGRVVQEAESQLRNLLRDHANTRIQEMNGLYADARAEGDEELMRYYAAEITRLSGLLKIYPPPSSVFRDLQSPRT